MGTPQTISHVFQFSKPELLTREDSGAQVSWGRLAAPHHESRQGSQSLQSDSSPTDEKFRMRARHYSSDCWNNTLSYFISSISCLSWLGNHYSSVSPISFLPSCNFLLVGTQLHFLLFACFSCLHYLLLSASSLAFPFFISVPLLLQCQQGNNLETPNSSWAVSQPTDVLRC